MAFKLPNVSELTLIQKQVYNDIVINKTERLAVLGGPGTGKTVLLMLAINQLNIEKERLLFLVYNKPLKKFIGTSVIANPNAKFNNYHAWIGGLYRKYQRPFNENDNYSFDWDDVECMLMENHVHYDSVFVDEAQDLPIELVKILDKITDKMYVFFDSNQKIDGDNKTKDAILSCLDLEERFYDLIDNHRNTIEIEQFAKMFGNSYQANKLTLKRITSKRHGDKVAVIDTNNIQLLAKKIVNTYLSNPGKNVGVLLPKMNSNIKTYFEYYYLAIKNEIDSHTEVKIPLYGYLNGPYPACDENGVINDETFNDDGICLMTFKGSKGLEFDIVYMVEMNNKDISINFVQDLNSIYVAITRCRDLLNIAFDSAIYNKKSLNNLVINYFKENEQYSSICSEFVLM